jgi:hypothetical protein
MIYILFNKIPKSRLINLASKRLNQQINCFFSVQNPAVVVRKLGHFHVMMKEAKKLRISTVMRPLWR